MSAANSSACSASSLGSTSCPPTWTPRSQVRWLRPTWPSRRRRAATPSAAAKRRWKPIATLHSPTARWPASSSARVTMPTGLVKSTIQASGASSATRAAMSRTTGTVRSALASPPAPVVSCPTQPQAGGSVSSTCRAAWPPTRSCSSTAPAPSTPSSSTVVVRITPGWPYRAKIRRENPPTSSRRRSSGSTSASSVTGSVSRSRAMPSTSSGVYVDPPPTTQSFIPSPPSASRPG